MTDQYPRPTLAVGGSRSLAPEYRFRIRRFIAAALRCRFQVSVGCARGADEYALEAATALDPARVSVFTAGAEDGEGFWAGSAPLALFRSAAAAGAQVAWLAGGPLSIPLPARLIRRSSAALEGAMLAVYFLSAPDSRGSLRVAEKAAAAGLQVYAFACGFEGPPSPLHSAGSWQPDCLAGMPCWQWQPAADQLSLF